MLKIDKNQIFYHFFSNDLYRHKGTYNAKFFFTEINKLKRKKKEIKINLFQDKLVRYLLK